MTVSPRLTLSMSILLANLVFVDRPAAAAALGYDSVESWWPWQDDSATFDQIDEFAQILTANSLSLYLLNVTEGSERFGGRGLACIAEAGDEFWANTDSLLAVVAATQARYINVLAGNLDDETQESAIETLVDRVSVLADRAAELGAGVVIEHLNPIDHPHYLLSDADLAVEVVSRVTAQSHSGNVGLLADIYHLGRSGVDPVAFVAANAPVIHHVQLADAPGRGRPGSGALPIRDVVAVLEAVGYTGRYGLEYLPVASEGIPSPAEFWRELSL